MDAEEHGRLHFEWESGTLPFFAWPTDGDRATVWGSWIWDCGHWSSTENNAAGSTTTGEHTELHPLSAIVVQRRAPFATTRNESQTDVFISNDGNGAHAVQQCALKHKPSDNTRYDPGFKTCSETKANKKQPLLRSYSFFVPAPHKPAAGAKLHYRVVSQVRGGSGRERVQVKPNGLAVTVSTKTKYGKTFFVSWTPDKVKPTTLKVTIQSLLIKQADPNPANPDPTPPAWNLYLNVNGFWALLNDWAPGLSAVTDGQLIQVNRSFTISVPKGGPVWLQMSGRECDEPGDTTVFGIYAPIVQPCGANRDEINSNPLLLLSNDGTGWVLDTYPSTSAALGDHVSKSKATVTFPGTGTMSAGHYGEGEDVYELTYSIAPG
jgi:hypothetical protein